MVSEHFDVIAKAPEQAPLADIRLMFRALLAERFHLELHREQRNQSVDVLTLTRPGVLGPKLSRVEPCAEAPKCQAHVGFGQVTTASAPLDQLATALTVATRRTVVNRTGLDGYFAFTLTYTPDAVALEPAVRAEFPAIDPDGPSLSTALKEQLGLTLRSTTEPVDVLIVDRVERPSFD